MDKVGFKVHKRMNYKSFFFLFFSNYVSFVWSIGLHLVHSSNGSHENECQGFEKFTREPTVGKSIMNVVLYCIGLVREN